MAPIKHYSLDANNNNAKSKQFMIGIFDSNGRLIEKIGYYPESYVDKELNFNGPDFVTCYQHPYLYILPSISTEVEVFNLEKKAYSAFELPPGHRRNYDLVNLKDTLIRGIQSITHGYKKIDKINDHFLYFYQVPDNSVPGFRFNSIVTLLSLKDNSYFNFDLNKQQGKTGIYISSNDYKDRIFYILSSSSMSENMILHSTSIPH